MRIADETRVPAGGALAVDRTDFSKRITEELKKHPNIELISREITEIPTEPAVIATGPLTDGALMRNIENLLGDSLHFFDAAAPIVTLESLDMNRIIRASRYGRGNDYLNCHMTMREYYEFVRALVSAETAPLHEFETVNVFEGCMPVEVMAKRGDLTLAYGPLKPVGIRHPETGEKWHGYKEDGYLPEAFINMLALLGWNPGTEQEIFTLQELCDQFSLERVNKSGARFNPDKAKWFNHKYLVQKSDTELAVQLNEFLVKDGISYDITKLEKICRLLKERANFVADIYNSSQYFYHAPQAYDEKGVKKSWKEETPVLMQELIEVLEKVTDFTSPNTEEAVKEWVAGKEIGFGKIMNPFRLAIIGSADGPHMFDIIEILEKEETLTRLHRIISTLK